MPGVDHPTLLEFPEQFTTERLILRPPKPGDGATMHAAVIESQAELSPWLSWAVHPLSAEEYEALCRRKYADWVLRTDLMLTLWRRSDGQFIGASGLHRINWSVPCVEIGYWCRTSLAGHGYITEAVQGITQFAFEHLGAQRSEIRVDTRNVRSIAVAQRAGYTLEATLKRLMRGTDGTLRDFLIFVRFPPAGE